MDIVLVTPARPHTRHGNRNTALRWAAMLRALGHEVKVQVDWDGKPADMMIALHARRSQDAIARFAERCPERPLLVVLTGTDLYRDIDHDAGAKRSLRLATRLVTLHELAVERVRRYRDKVRVVIQSARAARPARPLSSCFEVLVSGHLREEKDPLRAALALQHVPEDSRIRVTHVGRALDPALGEAAQACMARTPRYRWLGDRPHWQALRLMRRARLMVISSRMEGGANVVSEALAAGTPIIASRIPGNVGLLGPDYAGYYRCGDERALGKLLARAEIDPGFYAKLKKQCAARKRMVQPGSERAALARIIAEFE